MAPPTRTAAASGNAVTRRVAGLKVDTTSITSAVGVIGVAELGEVHAS